MLLVAAAGHRIPYSNSSLTNGTSPQPIEFPVVVTVLIRDYRKFNGLRTSLAVPREVGSAILWNKHKHTMNSTVHT